jgi:hypothetical protein
MLHALGLPALKAEHSQSHHPSSWTVVDISPADGCEGAVTLWSVVRRGRVYRRDRVSDEVIGHSMINVVGYVIGARKTWT